MTVKTRTDLNSDLVTNLPDNTVGSIDAIDVRTALKNINDSALLSEDSNKILDAIKTVDGTGSGLDSDLLDGQEGSYYLDAGNATGTLPSGRFPDGVLPSSIATPSTDFNSLTTPGWQPGIYNGTNPHSPKVSSTEYYWVQCLVYAGTEITQIAYSYSSPANQIWIRGKYSGTWSAWTKMMTNGDPVSFQSMQLNDNKTFIDSTGPYGTVSTYSNGSGNGAFIGYDDNTDVYGRIGYTGYAFYGAGPSYLPALTTTSLTINDGLQQFATFIGDSSKYMMWNKTNGTQRGYVGYGSSDETFHIYNGGPVKIVAGNSSTVDFGVDGQSTFSHRMTVLGDSGYHTITATAAPDTGAVLGYSNNSTVYGILGYSNTYSFYGVGTFNNVGSATITGSLSKGSGTFLIDHPLDPENRDLRHGFVEAPRYDLIYRGTVNLIDGRAEIDIDLESNMTSGTFTVLTTNAVVTSLQNQTGFDRLKPSEIIDGKFNIICENVTSTDKISWVVIAERNDPFVKSDLDHNTDENGRFIPEVDKEEYDG